MRSSAAGKVAYPTLKAYRHLKSSRNRQVHLKSVFDVEKQVCSLFDLTFVHVLFYYVD